MTGELSFRKYAAFWNKYRPAILKMMQGTSDEGQQYQFMKHELLAIEKRPKSGFEFRLVIAQSKATNDIRNYEIAKDLLNMLQQSKTGSALIAANRYEIVLDKTQTLRISRQAVTENI